MIGLTGAEERVLRELRDHAPRKYTAEQLVEATGISLPRITTAAYRLTFVHLADDTIGLINEDGHGTAENPHVWWSVTKRYWPALDRAYSRRHAG